MLRPLSQSNRARARYRFIRKVSLATSLLAACAFTAAQDTNPFKEQYKLIKAPNAVVSLGVDIFESPRVL